MQDKNHTNNIKFGLYQGDSAIAETIFSADVFNPVVRYSVDIRDIIPSIISRLQRTLSRRNFNYKIDFKNVNKKDNTDTNITYDFLKYYKTVSSLEKKPFDYKLKIPNNNKIEINGFAISGVEFKFGLYINDNPIVERNFYVEGYNPSSRFSIELGGIINDIVREIYGSLKKNDIAHMWNDYLLIKTYGLNINQVRELSKGRRTKMLERASDRSFIKKMQRNLR